uniref:Uncharacterized protein n=1 Tax=Physcomitrium patens TaxID=3218 RepID=A0A7I4DDG5_PHYPA
MQLMIEHASSSGVVPSKGRQRHAATGVDASSWLEALVREKNVFNS